MGRAAALRRQFQAAKAEAAAEDREARARLAEEARELDAQQAEILSRQVSTSSNVSVPTSSRPSVIPSTYLLYLLTEQEPAAALRAHEPARAQAAQPAKILREVRVCEPLNVPHFPLTEFCAGFVLSAGLAPVATAGGRRLNAALAPVPRS